MAKWDDYFLGVADAAPDTVRLRYGRKQRPFVP